MSVAVFEATDDIHGHELFVTDGTAAGTKLLDNITPDHFYQANGTVFDTIISVANGAFVFYQDLSTGDHLVFTDGSTSGTYTFGGYFYNDYPVATIGNKFYFYAIDGTSDNGTPTTWGLWEADSSKSTATLVTQPVLADEGTTLAPHAADAVEKDGQLYFFENRLQYGGVTSQYDLVRLDPATNTITDVGISAFVSPDKIGHDDLPLALVGDKFFYTSFTEETGTELWVTDGTVGGTHIIKDIETGADGSRDIYQGNVDGPFEFDGKVLFFASDSTNGAALWATDGTEAGTTMILDLAPGKNPYANEDLSGYATGSSFYNSLALINGKAVINDPDRDSVYLTDGTAAGTSLLAFHDADGNDIKTGSLQCGGKTDNLYNNYLVDGNDLYFRGVHYTGVDENGHRLYTSGLYVADLTTGLATLVKEIHSFATEDLRDFHKLNGHIIFDDEGKIWTTDGTAAGTKRLVDLNPGGLDTPTDVTVIPDGTTSQANATPVLAHVIVDRTVAEHTAWSFTVPDNAFTDPDGDALTYSATLADGSDLPSWLSFDATTKTFTGAPPAGFVGAVVLRVVVSDGELSADDRFMLTVTNTAPVVAHAIADQTLSEDTAWNFTVAGNAFVDAGGDALTYSATMADGGVLPSWLTFNAETRTFDGTPPEGFTGIVSLKVTASDGIASASDTFDLTIAPPGNSPPTDIALSATTVAENVAPGTVVGTLSGTDPDAGDTLTFSFVKNPGNTFEIEDGKLVVAEGAKLDFETRDSYTVTLRATDTDGLHFDKAFTVDITDVIDRLSGTPQADTLHGGTGADIITGLAGKDKLYGGGGPDTFVFLTDDSGKSHAKADTIYDFGKDDAIDLTGWDANSKKAGFQDFSFIGTKEFGGHAGELHFVKDSSDTWIEGDTNGDKKADLVIHLTDSMTLKGAFFDL